MATICKMSSPVKINLFLARMNGSLLVLFASALGLLCSAPGLVAHSNYAPVPPGMRQITDLSNWGELSELGGGWVQSSWYGTFNTWNYPWIVHSEHGFQWVLQTGETGGAFYFFDMEIGWVFTGPDFYPDIYGFSLDGGGAWLSYAPGSVQPRFFFRYETGSWIRIPAEESTATDFVLISAGTYMRGSAPDELGRWEDESPHHQVTLTRDFAIQTTEVTNAQFASVINWALGEGLVNASETTITNASGETRELLDLSDDSQLRFQGGQLLVDSGKDNRPVIEVTWYGAMAYCYLLSLREGLNPAVDPNNWTINPNSSGYRLPTEAEWEYACRAGTTTAFNNGPITTLGSQQLDPNLDRAGWYAANSQNPEEDMIDGLSTRPVGLKQRNEWGLYDMHGNVWEWCSDWFAPYPGRSVTDPEGPGFFSDTRNIRGGSFYDSAESCRSATRYWALPEESEPNIGFRPVRTQLP